MDARLKMQDDSLRACQPGASPDAPPSTPKDELLRALRALIDEFDGDTEQRHVDADNLLLKFIGDPAVTEAFHAIDKWYA
jgi:hypothetical protein